MSRPAFYHKGMSLDDLMAWNQLSILRFHLEQTNSNFKKFCDVIGANSTEEMTVRQFFEGIAAINDKVEKLNRRAVK